jgi:hypothetical protein
MDLVKEIEEIYSYFHINIVKLIVSYFDFCDDQLRISFEEEKNNKIVNELYIIWKSLTKFKQIKYEPNLFRAGSCDIHNTVNNTYHSLNDYPSLIQTRKSDGEIHFIELFWYINGNSARYNNFPSKIDIQVINEKIYMYWYDSDGNKRKNLPNTLLPYIKSNLKNILKDSYNEKFETYDIALN